MTQALLVLFSISIPIILHGILKARSALVDHLGADILFPALSLSAGLLEGYLFSSVNHVYSVIIMDKDGAGIAGLLGG